MSVEYTLTSSDRTNASVTLENGRGGTEQRDVIVDGTWSYVIDNPVPNAFLYISAQSTDDAFRDIACQIVIWVGDQGTVRGVVISEASSLGEFVIVSCDGSYSTAAVERGRAIVKQVEPSPTPTQVLPRSTPVVVGTEVPGPIPTATSVPIATTAATTLFPDIPVTARPWATGITFVFEPARLRMAPRLDAEQVTTVPNETPVEIFGMTAAGDWLLIRVPSANNAVGWIFRDLVFTTDALDDVPIEPDK